MCRFLIGALLCVQWAIAAHACAGAAAIAAAQPVTAAAAMIDCDMAMPSADAAVSPVCAEHCRHGQQADAVPSLTLPVAVSVSLYPLPASVVLPMRHAGRATTVAALGPAPPPLEAMPGRLRV